MSRPSSLPVAIRFRGQLIPVTYTEHTPESWAAARDEAFERMERTANGMTPGDCIPFDVLARRCAELQYDTSGT